MKLRPFVSRLGRCGSLIFLGVIFTASVWAQTAPGTLRGKVTDPSGAVIPDATITAIAANGQKTSATTDHQGVYEIKGLLPGSYTVSALGKGFAEYHESEVQVNAGQVQQFDIALGIQVQQEQVSVEAQANTVSVSPSENASALIIKGKDLEALSDDPDELQSELSALAGPSAGPNGGQIYIDGFTGGQLPPKSSIREIRVNQNCLLYTSEDWRQRGMNGVVKAVDPASGIITVSTGSLAAKAIAVHVSKDTLSLIHI